MQQSTQIDTDTIQEAIVKEFQTLEGDRESMLGYIMDLGERLPPMSAAEKIENNTVKGCLSTVWLTYTKKDDLLFFKADSNTAITRGAGNFNNPLNGIDKGEKQGITFTIQSK